MSKDFFTDIDLNGNRILNVDLDVDVDLDAHNLDPEAHPDIRQLIADLANEGVNTLATNEPITLANSGQVIAERRTSGGTWDHDLQEPGAAIYDPVTELWIAPYSGRGAGETQVGAVLSTDGGVTWGAHPDNPILATIPYPDHGNPAIGSDLGFEDPYLVKDATTGTVWRDSDGCAHIYVEEKYYALHVGVGLWKSAPNTLSDWTWEGQVVPNGGGAPQKWDATDRTSPTVIHHNGLLVMLFEGRWIPDSNEQPQWQSGTEYEAGDVAWRNPSDVAFYRALTTHTSTSSPPEDEPTLWERTYGQLGKVGIAWSDDEGETWEVADEPLVDYTGTWAVDSIVPDDVILVDGKWVLLCHGQNTAGSYNSIGRLSTTDEPATWGPESFTELPGNPVTTLTNTLMCWGNDPKQALRQTAFGLERMVVVQPDPDWDEARIASIQQNVEAVQGDIIDLQAADVVHDSRLDALEGAAPEPTDLLPTELGVTNLPPRVAATEFDFTTDSASENAVGPGPGSVLTLPNARIESVDPPYPDTFAVGAGTVLPGAPVAGARLLGVTVRIAVEGIDYDFSEIVPFAQLLDVNGGFQPATGRVIATGGWGEAFGGGVTFATIVDAEAAQSEQVVTFWLDSPVEDAGPFSFIVIAGWLNFSGEGTLGDGSAYDIATVEWLWDRVASGGGGGGGAPDPHAETHQLEGDDELALDAAQITAGTLDPSRIPSGIARIVNTDTNSGNTIYVGSVAPTSPATGDVWIQVP
jgi:hypothetical protein